MKKKIAILSLLVLISSIALGAQPQFLQLRSYQKGLNSHVSDYSVPEGQSAVLENVRINRRFGSLTKRTAMIQYADAGSMSIEGLHRYYKSDFTQKMIAAGGTNLFVGNDALGTFSAIGQGFSDGQRWDFLTYKDVAIGTNGVDQPIKFDGNVNVTANTDGHRTSGDSVTQLGAPFAELNTGSTLDASAWYQYRVAFYNGANYSYSTSRSNPINTGSTVRDITLTDIPLGPTGTTQRIIYRTVGDASRSAVIADTTFYRVATISDNTTTTYNDAIADTTIDDDSAPTWATVIADEIPVTPPIVKFITIHDGKLFSAGNPDSQSSVYWSDTFNPDYFYPTDEEQIRPDDGDFITFIEEYLGKLAVGKTRTIQRFYTDDTNSANWSISAPFSFVGCVAPYSVAVAPIGIIYLSWNGLYSFTGQTSQLISDAVTEDINDILSSRINEAAGFYFKNEYHLAYTSNASGEASNNRVLIYDVIRDAYVLDTKNINSFAALDSGDDLGTLYLGSSLDDGKVWADEGSDSVLKKRFKSEFDAGTFDDARAYNTETIPIIDLAWDLTIDEGVGTIDGHSYGTPPGSAIIDRPDTDGTWESPVYEVNAGGLLKLQWNEQLNTLGDITWQIRTCTTSDCSASVYSSAFTDPTGSDISGVTANNFIQLKASLSTSDITVTPNLVFLNGYVFRLFYTRTGSVEESAFSSQWESGWLDFGNPGYKKTIKRIRILYRGTAGTITLTYKNDEGDVNRTFDVNLATASGTDSDGDGYDEYTGVGDFKVYTHYPTQNTEADPYPVGEHFKFSLEETGSTEWEIAGIEIEFSTEQLGPM